MEESFRARVDKVFGSLASSRSSLWSITDDEVQRKEWRRPTDTSGRDETPCSSSFDDYVMKNRGGSRRRNFDDEEQDEGFDGPNNPGQDDQDEWAIRSSIGMDRTLDYEDEEDEFDKVAAGREDAGDRLYMKDVTEHGSYLNSHNVLPNSLHRHKKDSRANLLAAKLRLKEDEAEAEAQNLNSSMASAPEVEGSDVKESKEDDKPKPILKRKTNETCSKSQKRVRFDVKESNGCEESSPISDCGSLMGKSTSGVPDYLVNPSKYTRYSFESTDEVDEVQNSRAQMKSSNREAGSEMENASPDLPKSVTFVSRKKVTDDIAINNSENEKEKKEDEREKALNRAGFRVGIAAEEDEGDICKMEADEPETNSEERCGGFRKPGRKYRTLLRSDVSDSS
ncbi:hypothetical protein UlMin_039992 [Ulmus minor]